MEPARIDEFRISVLPDAELPDPAQVDIAAYHRVQLREGIDLFVAPRKVEQWQVFTSDYPPFSIALDGFVYGKPQFESSGPFLNANHHEEVERLPTRATCAQIFLFLKQGMLDAFQQDGKVRMNIFVNDPDQDTCLAVWLLKNHHRIAGQYTDKVICNLVDLEDRYDVTAGAYPIGSQQSELEALAWIFEPYTEARHSGELARFDGASMAQCIHAVSRRIDQHVEGIGQKIPLDTRFSIIGGGDGWALIEEQGAHARTKLFADGIKAFVSVRSNGDGSYVYSIGKMSPFISFPIDDLYTILNEAEGIGPDESNRWGGSHLIGGSPREIGSRIPPKMLEKIINELLKRSNQKLSYI